MATSVRCPRLDRREALVDPFEQVRLFQPGRDRHANEGVGQANVGKDTGVIVVKVKKGARLQGKNPRSHFAEHGAGTEILEKRRYASEGGGTGAPHGTGSINCETGVGRAAGAWRLFPDAPVR